jgi:hypothetical protein
MQISTRGKALLGWLSEPVETADYAAGLDVSTQLKWRHVG